VKNYKKIINDPETMLRLSEFYFKMSEFQLKYDHPRMALNCYITSKTLLYWAKVVLGGHEL
jgi:hypothetical protein